jgi:outer membrane protein
MIRMRVFLLGFAFAGAFVTRCAAQNAPAAPQSLTLQQAEQTALQNHPQLQAAQSLEVVAKAQAQETRSAYYPYASASLTGAMAESGSRIAAGGLNNPIIYDRYANGVTVGQLVTDFGRTHELVKSSDLHVQAQQSDTIATRADVLLRVDRAYFGALKAQTLLNVAQETVAERQLVADQVTTMAQNQLRSDLDVSFANVDLAQAQLLLVQVQNDLETSFAELSYALGYNDQRRFQLAEEPMPTEAPGDLAPMIAQALANRPDLAGRRLDAQSAQSYATAERDLWFPTLSSVGAAGLVPFRQDTLTSRYAAAGFNLNVPIFNGHLFGALRSEASARAEAQEQELRDLEDLVVRDVRTAWLNAKTDYQRLSVTDQLLAQANQALDLAQSRYQLGLGSIVELSQAQLNATQARIAETSARYDYRIQQSELNFELGNLR